MKVSYLKIAMGLAILATTAIGASAQEETEAKTRVPAAESSVYLLAPFDKISVSVYGEPDLSTQQRLADDGTAHIPLIGEVEIGGMTVSQAAKRIEKEFVSQEYLRKPVVTISIEEFAAKVLTVMGEVNEPGSITLSPGVNGVPIQIAIAEAGGFKNTAKTGEVSVTRARPEGEEASTLVVDVDEMLRRSSASEPPLMVRPGDVVFVPRRVF